MAKNNSVIWYRGQNLQAGTLGRMLPKHWTEFSNAITQKVILYGGESAKLCAEMLLEEAKNMCPVGMPTNSITKEHKDNYAVSKTGTGKGEWQGVGSASFKSRMSKVGKHVTSKNGSDYFQFRDSMGRWGKKIEIFKEKNGLHSFTHQNGSLIESGRVLKYQQSDGDKKVGYEVSFDTRRTDPRSIANNFNYAVKQHEDASLHHFIGKSHFLKIPYDRNKKQMIEWIAEGVKKAFTKGGGGK